MNYDYLDSVAADIKAGNESPFGVLSTGERIYVALAANRLDLVPDYTVAQALARLGEAHTLELVDRWR